MRTTSQHELYEFEVERVEGPCQIFGEVKAKNDLHSNTYLMIITISVLSLRNMLERMIRELP